MTEQTPVYMTGIACGLSLAGATRCKNRGQTVYMTNDGLWAAVRLANKPVQPGQQPFIGHIGKPTL